MIWLVYGLCLLWFVRRPTNSLLGHFALISSIVTVTVLDAVLLALLFRS